VNWRCPGAREISDRQRALAGVARLLTLPIYLSADVQAYFVERAAEKGMPLGKMVNTLLKQEIKIIESVK
jgi:hypothetical protein